jgi:hypothetical protein
VFEFQGSVIAFTLTKIDRSKLYGYKEVVVLDERDRPCELATLADAGCTVVGRGGTGLGYVSADGNWCGKSQLKPVDLDGRELQPVLSSFAAPIPLSETAGIAESVWSTTFGWSTCCRPTTISRRCPMGPQRCLTPLWRNGVFSGKLRFCLPRLFHLLQERPTTSDSRHTSYRRTNYYVRHIA